MLLASYTVFRTNKYDFDQVLYHLGMSRNNYHHNSGNTKSLFEKISKIFHFIWNSSFLNSTNQSNIELRVRKNIQTCMKLHLDWEFKIWTDDMVRDEFPELVDLLIAASIPSVKSDILRMIIIAKFGGIYMDTDFLCVHNFDAYVCLMIVEYMSYGRCWRVTIYGCICTLLWFFDLLIRVQVVCKSLSLTPDSTIQSKIPPNYTIQSILEIPSFNHPRFHQFPSDSTIQSIFRVPPDSSILSNP